METKTYLGRYLTTLDQYGQPIRLRQNGSAVIYKAFDAESNREVALEVIPTRALPSPMQAKLEAEAEAARRLQQINLPMLYDFGIEEDQLIYAFEMVEGVTAELWVSTQGPMPLGSALRIASQIVNALGAATFHGIFHHALNPANVMIVPGQTAEGEWPLIKVMNVIGPRPSYLPAEKSAAGVADKINFVAPEQLENGGTADFASQIYSLGCTLWFLLSGAPPLGGAATVDAATRVPAPVRRLVSQMLAVDPHERPLDPIALHAQIEDCIAEVDNNRVVAPAKSSPARVAAVPDETVEARQRRPFPWQPLAVAAVLLLLGTLGALLLPQRLRSRGAQRDIGVPVGVPDSVAVAAATRNAPEPLPSAATREEPVDATAAATPGVLISTAGGDENRESDTPSPAVAEEQPVQPAAAATANVAQNTAATPQAEETAPPAYARNSSANETVPEVAPPAEGPAGSADNSTTEPESSSAVVSADANQPAVRTETKDESTTRVADEATSAPTTATRLEKPTAKTPRRPVKKQPAIASTRRERGGSVRAQFLGTTPEGELIFGLPSEQRAYLNPDNQRRASSVRRHRRVTVRPAEPPDNLPVLPALPPDE